MGTRLRDAPVVDDEDAIRMARSGDPVGDQHRRPRWQEDAIGVRTHETGQRVLLYPVYASQERKARMFRDLMQDVANASEQPEFYNTIFDNYFSA